MRSLTPRAKLLLQVWGIWLASRVLLYIFTALSQHVLPPGGFSETHSPQLLQLLNRWDSGWYEGLARHGYKLDPLPGHQSNVVFYPLFPMVLKLLDMVGLDIYTGGVIFNNLALLGAALILALWVQKDRGEATALRAATLFLVFPATVFYSSLYTESLFCLLLAAFFLALQRERWWWAGVAGLLLSATRSAGVLVAIPLAIDAYLRHRKDGWKKLALALAPVLLVPLGMVLFFLYMKLKFGDAMLPMSAQSAWDRRLTWPWTTYARTFARHFQTFYLVMLAGAPLFLLAVIGWMAKLRLRWSYIAYSVASLLLIVSAGTLDSTPRFVSAVLPMYLALALVEETAYTALVVAFSMGFAVMTLLVANGYWMT
jgi:Gpi18-like mannosyltransferase